jgi:lipopolysaccharide export system permease protein
MKLHLAMGGPRSLRFRMFLALRYILGEMIPTFFLGVIVFVFILLMFQALRLTEFVLIHGVKISLILQLMGYMSTSFLPILFPMSLLFTIILTYGRLSSDSEIVAFKSVGLSMWSIIAPAFVLSVLVTLLSAQMAFHVAPWGNRQFELLFTKIGASKPEAALREGTFSEGFFDLVVYANHVDNKNGVLDQVFIYDDHNHEAPLTVIAREGRLMINPDKPTHEALLRLFDGSMHRTKDGQHTKIDFSSYDVHLSDPVNEEFKNKTPPSLTLEDIQTGLADPKTKPEDVRMFKTEFHKRLAISVACILFALIGVGLGTTTNRRSAKSGGMVICLGLIMVYWVIYIVGEGLARDGTLAPAPAMWLANAIFAVAAIWSLKRGWN